MRRQHRATAGGRSHSIRSRRRRSRSCGTAASSHLEDEVGPVDDDPGAEPSRLAAPNDGLALRGPRPALPRRAILPALLEDVLALAEAAPPLYDWQRKAARCPGRTHAARRPTQRHAPRPDRLRPRRPSHGWTFPAIQGGDSTLGAYAAPLRRRLPARAGRRGGPPLLEVARRRERRVLRQSDGR